MTDKDRIHAGIEFIKSCEAYQVQVRYYEDIFPAVWVIVARFKATTEIEADITCLDAVIRLCERVVEERRCRYCERRIAFESHKLTRMPLDRLICWYQYDPELKLFRRGCE